jgi:poly [ADP-ribose] polymerase
MMEAQMTELEYDIKKQPLGRLSKNTIKSGYTVLKELETAINGGDGDVEELTNRFYTLIPHVFGMKRPPLIKTLDQVRTKLAMIEALADIEVASTLLKASKGAGSVIDANYEKLNCHIEPVRAPAPSSRRCRSTSTTRSRARRPRSSTCSRSSATASTAASPTSAPTSATASCSGTARASPTLSAFCRRACASRRQRRPSRATATARASTFADQASLSVNYCRTYGSPNFCMLLADVALGKPAELTSDQYMEKPLAKTNSTLAIGSWVPSNEKKMELRKPKLPSNSKASAIDHSVEVPLGKPVSKTVKTACYENQYIVYDVGQAKLQYLILFEQ